MRESDAVKNWRRQIKRMRQDPDGRTVLAEELGVHYADPDEKDRPLVAILVPTNRTPKPAMENSLSVMVAHARKIMGVHRPRIYGHSVIHWTRNEMIAQLYHENVPFTHVLFCDDDMELAPDTLERLVSHNAAIVGALTTRRCDPPIPTMRVFDPVTGDWNQVLQWEGHGGLIQKDGVGTGVMLISRSAIETIGDFYLDCGYERHMGFDAAACDKWAELRKKEFDRNIDGGRFFKNAMWFQFLPSLNGRGEYGEDISFCLKAKLCNIPVHIDTTVTPGHIGDYSYSFADFLEHKPALIAEQIGRQMICCATGQETNLRQRELVKGEPTKKVSVLIPTRGRGKLLADSIISLLKWKTGEVEILIRIDEDDTADYEWLNDTDDVRKIVGPRYGYANFHEYYNELAKQATGDWLLIWNDDAVMETPGWDAKIHEFGTGLKLLNATGPLNLFPVISRELYETMEHISLNAHCDSWLQVVARMNGIEYPVEFDVRHLREELDDETKKNTQANYQSKEYFSAEVQNLVYQDVRKVKLALATPKPEAVPVG